MSVRDPKSRLGEFLGETRIVTEYLRFRDDTINSRNHRTVPCNCRSVLLIPGFMAGDATLYPLGARLKSLGHRVFYSGIWVNADCPMRTLGRLRLRLCQIADESGRGVVIVGHSLGGLYAREVARVEPTLVERIFLLGSPVRHSIGNATPLLLPFIAAMKMLHMHCVREWAKPCDLCGIDLPSEPPGVPETVIYSRSDGIVRWHSCIEHGPRVECFEVNSSHCGMPLNPRTWELITARLGAPTAVSR